MSALEKKKPRPAVKEFVSPVINDDEGRTLIRSMRLTDKLQDLMDFYYAMVPTIPRGTGVFLYQGKRVDGEERPVDYNMSKGSGVIEFLSEMKPCMFVTLTVHDSEGRRVTRTMRRSDEMKVLMRFYNSTVSCTCTPTNTGVFWYDGKRVEMWHTPEFLNMKDGARINFCPELQAKMLLTLTVVDSQRRRIARTIRVTDTLQDLMDFYYATVPIVEFGCGRFAFDGRAIKGSQTPMDLNMQDGDVIDFLVLQRGK